MKESILSSFLSNYVKIYLVDLDADTITLVADANGTELENEVITGKYSEYVHLYIYSRLNPEHNDQRLLSEKYCGIDYIKERLSKYASYSLSYYNVDSEHVRLEFIRYEMNGKVPSKILIGAQKNHTQDFDERDYQHDVSRYLARTEEQLQALRIDHERDSFYRGALSRNVLSSFEVNITNNMVVSAFAEDANLFYHVEGVDVPGPLDIHSASWSTRILSDNQEEFRAFIKRENLLHLYEIGEDEPWIDYLIEGLDGTRVWINETVSMSQDEETGDVVGLIILRDVTEQKLTYLENQRRMGIISGLTNEYETLYLADLFHDRYSIYRFNEAIMEKHKPVFVDSYAESIRLFAESAVYEHDREKFISNLSQEHIQSELKDKEYSSFSFRVGEPSDQRFYRAKISRVAFIDGIPSECVIGFSNIQQEVEEEMRQKTLLEDALEQARHAVVAKSAFLSNMSHDIRTPMNAIVGYTNIAAEHLDEPERVRKLLNNIVTSSNHLLQLINNALDVSRIESGRMKLIERRHRLSDIVEGVSTIIESEVQKKDIQYTAEIDEALCDEVYCDRLRVTQLILNLLSNAVKYTHDHGIVTLRLRNLGGAGQGYQNVEITVSDNGVGIGKQFIDRLFEPFERENTSTISQLPGSGLGLSICKGIVDSMGGTINVRSQKNVGTVFTVKFFLRLQDQSETASVNTSKTLEALRGKTKLDPELLQIGIFKPSEEKKAGVTRSLEGLRALLVEDNVLNREIADELLKECGLQVEFAGNGQVALDRISDRNPGYYDIVFMDVQMPVMDGLEATRQIRKLSDPKNAEVPVIAMTANAFNEDMQNAQEAGMNAYICKPLESYAIRYVLEQII